MFYCPLAHACPCGVGIRCRNCSNLEPHSSKTNTLTAAIGSATSHSIPHSRVL